MVIAAGIFAISNGAHASFPENGVFYALYFEENLARFDGFSGKTEEIEDSELEIDDHLSIFKRDLGTGHAKRLLIWREGFLTPLKMGLYKTF